MTREIKGQNNKIAEKLFIDSYIYKCSWKYNLYSICTWLWRGIWNWQRFFIVNEKRSIKSAHFCNTNHIISHSLMLLVVIEFDHRRWWEERKKSFPFPRTQHSLLSSFILSWKIRLCLWERERRKIAFQLKFNLQTRNSLLYSNFKYTKNFVLQFNLCLME